RPPIGDEVQGRRREQEQELEPRHVPDLGPDFGEVRDLGVRVEEADRDDRDGEQDLDDPPDRTLAFGRTDAEIAVLRRYDDLDVVHLEARKHRGSSVARPFTSLRWWVEHLGRQVARPCPRWGGRTGGEIG